MQEVLYRCAWYYVHHYREFLDVIPYEERVLEILEYSEGKSFPGGNLPASDYLICEDGSLKIC